MTGSNLVSFGPCSTSDEQLPQYLHNSDRLPAYSKFSQHPTSKALPDRYELRSRRMTLDLGQRYPSTPIAAFGSEGLVEARVWIQRFENVERIQVTLSGAIALAFLEMEVPVRPVVKRLAHLTLTLWSKDDSQYSNDLTQPLPFALPLPEHIEGMTDHLDRPIPLPPSASIVTQNGCVHVAYTIRIDMFKKGWRSHEKIKSEILYLPRTTVLYFQPRFSLPNSEKERPCSHEEWNVAVLPPASKKACSGLKSDQKPQTKPHLSIPQSMRDDVVIRFWLPEGLRYPAGKQILWHLTFVFPNVIHAHASSASSVRPGSTKSSDLNDHTIDALVAAASIRLVRVSAIATHGLGSRREQVLATGDVFAIRPNIRTELGERKLALSGFLQSGETEQETGWAVPGFASVSYEIRVSIRPDGPNAPV